MAWEFRVHDITGLLAGEDLSTASGLTGYGASGQYLFAKMSPGNDMTVLHCSAAKDFPIGVIQNNPKSGKGCSVRQLGVSKVVAGATLLAEQRVGPNAAGRAVAKSETSTGADYGNFVAGIVLEGCAAGELATVLLLSPYHIH